jgi:hypothetical protein
MRVALQILLRAVAGILLRKGLLGSPLIEGSFVFTACTLLMAASGFASQLRNGFGVPIPWPLSMLLWPLDLLEWLVTTAVYLTK